MPETGGGGGGGGGLGIQVHTIITMVYALPEATLICQAPPPKKKKKKKKGE